MMKKKETIKQNHLLQYINPKNNDMFSEMSGIDLQDFLCYLENYYLELRDGLGFDHSITFGLELELENAVREKIADELREESLFDTWVMKYDASLNDGVEINSPILKDTSTSWTNLKKVCSIVNENAMIGPCSGGHVHVGTQVLGGKKESWLNFIKLWAVYENIIYRFSYGDFLSARPKIQRYAKPVAQDFWSDYQKLRRGCQLKTEDIVKKIDGTRAQAVNVRNVKFFNELYRKNTIEFRCPNASSNPIIWQNNVNLFVHLLLYSKSTSYNDDVIEKRKSMNEDKYAELYWYNEIYLQQALELCDMLFTNNFDKIYFLRQYLKSFEVEDKALIKAKTFTK